MTKTISIFVSGKVQGVFYRQSTREKAMAIGINGQVRNLPDGRVHIIATGSKEQLDQLLEWCRQGPPRARVSGIESAEMPLEHFDQFLVMRG
jgi:acylphosphatase